MYSETITLFNRYHSRIGDMWYPHILHNVDLIEDKAAVLAKYGTETADSAKLHIRYYSDGDQIMIGDLPYIDSIDWNNLTTDEMKNCITFNTSAVNFDFFIVGEYPDGEPIVDDPYSEIGFFETMSERMKCYVVTSASSPYKVIPHFEIMARR